MTSINLITSRRFVPYFVTQFTGAFNDSLIRRAVEMLIVFRGLSGDLAPSTAVFLLLALFMCPFFIFSAFAGYLADVGRKELLVRYIKIAELIIVGIAAYGLIGDSLLFCTLGVLGLGVHSAFFGPVKFSLPPEHLEERELVAANGLIEAGTNIAVLTGTIVGGLLTLAANGTTYISLLGIGVALTGIVASSLIPNGNQNQKQDIRTINRLGTYALIKKLWMTPTYWRLSIGISWFWTLGALLISLFTLLVKDVLHGPEYLVSIFFALFSIGVGCGSILCNRLLKGAIEATFVPVSALGMGLGLLVFSLLINIIPPVTDIYGLTTLSGAALCASLLLVSISAGLFVVPLYSMLQERTANSERSQIIAGNNILNASCMVIGSILMAILFSYLPVTAIIIILGLCNLVAALYSCLLLPKELIKGILRLIFLSLFKARIVGAAHLKSCKGAALIIPNHLSFLDAVMLGAFLPGDVAFAVNTEISKRWWLRSVSVFLEVVPIDPTNPMALRTLIDHLKKGTKVVIFPEGRITVTGTLMKIYEGPSIIADKTGAPLIPIRLEGFQYTHFSKMGGKVARRLLPQLTMIICDAVNLQVPAALKGKKRREALGIKLYDLMTEVIYRTNERGPTILHGLERIAQITHRKKIAAKDPFSSGLSVRQIIFKSFILSRLPVFSTAEHTSNLHMADEPLSGKPQAQEYIGILLPTGIPMLLSILATHWNRKVPALINYSHSLEQMLACCKTACITRIVTSRRFITLAKLSNHEEQLKSLGICFTYLDDEQQKLSFFPKLSGSFGYFIKTSFAKITGRSYIPGEANDSAVVLFTSGSEGMPKGVVLSHENLLHNVEQVTASVPVLQTDKVFNALPMFHSFGLTGATLMPLLRGAEVFLYPSSLHYKLIPECIYNETSTILFGTPTFLSGYGRKAHAYDFFSIRYIFSGAERLSDLVRNLYQDKFGLRIFEGYGATETSPVIAVNTPFHFKRGAVGRIVPGMEYRLEEIPGITDGGRLHVKGPNVMKGYLKADHPGVIQPPIDGWYDTGDIVSIDDQGFITIKGRAKRFAKIGGEMVSLTAIEQSLETRWPEAQHAILAISDPRKGERLIYLTTLSSANKEAVNSTLKAAGFTELWIPKEIQIKQKLPLLGSGKVDLVTLAREITNTTD